MHEFFAIFGWVLAAAVLSGVVCGAAGLLVVGLRIPFAVVCCSHLALAGAVWAMRWGLPTTPGAFVGAGVGALLAAWLAARRRVDTNAVLGVVFSVSLGLVFLGMHGGDGPQTDALSLLWGNLLFAGPREVLALALLAAVLALGWWCCGRALTLVLFSRDLARHLVPEPALFAGILVVLTLTTAIELELIGGLMLFSLICNPAAAAMLVARSVGAALAWSIGFAIFGALGGFALACVFNWPAGACIAVVSALPVVIAAIIRRPSS